MKNEISGVNGHWPVAICGAGVAGLALAIRLADLGIKAVVIEARTEAASFSEGEFLTLAPNGMNGLRAVGCFMAATEVGVETTGFELLNARGKCLAVAEQDDHVELFGAPSITLRRGRLIWLLLNKARALGIPVYFGERIVGLLEREDGVRLRSEAGRHFSADVVVAADGLRSALRQLAFPHYPSPQFTGLIGTGGVVEANVPSTYGRMRMTFGDNAFFGYLKAPDHPVFWFNSYSSPHAGDGRVDDPAGYLNFIRGLHANDTAPNIEILNQVDRIDRNYPVFDMPPLPKWSANRVVLIGDAAHAVGPHAGQGASMAIEDSLVLAACLSVERDYATAFEQYEDLRRDRVAQVVKVTARNSSQKRTTSKVGLFIRDLVLPVVVPLGIRAMERLSEFRVDQHPLRAPSG